MQSAGDSFEYKYFVFFVNFRVGESSAGTLDFTNKRIVCQHIVCYV